MEVKILEIRLQDNGKPLKAFTDIELNNIIIKDFRILQHPKQRAYVVAPQTSWRGQGGVIQYKTILTLPNELKWQVESAILAEFQKAQGKENVGKEQ